MAGGLGNRLPAALSLRLPDVITAKARRLINETKPAARGQRSNELSFGLAGQPSFLLRWC